MKKFPIDKLIVASIFFLVAAGVGINVHKQLSIDRSKIPEKVEEHVGFQRWITNLKNKGLENINADEFQLIEENEIYNTKWMRVYSLEQDGTEKEFLQNIEDHKNIDKIIFSPSERLYVDYRNETREKYKPNEVHFYGARDDKIIDARILDCSVSANCYFDRAYFLNNDVFVISEFARNIDKKAEKIPPCDSDAECEYIIKIHVVDLVNNSRLIYQSKPFNVILSKLIPEL